MFKSPLRVILKEKHLKKRQKTYKNTLMGKKNLRKNLEKKGKKKTHIHHNCPPSFFCCQS